MTRHVPERDPRSSLEDEGIPAEDGAPQDEWAVDPQQPSIPRDRPTAVQDYGVTAEEQAEPQPLDSRLRREVPEEQPEFGPDESEPAGRIVAPDEGAHADTETNEIGADAGPDRGGFTAEESAMRIEDENESGTEEQPDDL